MSSAYSIQNGKIVTFLLQTPFEVTVYKMGDKYFAARSNGLGYANYEIIPPVINLVENPMASRQPRSKCTPKTRARNPGLRTRPVWSHA